MKILPMLLTTFFLLFTFCPPAHSLHEFTSDPPAVGGVFPSFILPDVDGRNVALNDFSGKAILLSFWSCHTDTCYTSVRVIDSLLKDFGAEGLVAPTVCSEIPPAFEENSYAGLLERCSTGQVVLIDADQELTQRLGIKEFPTTYLIDRDFTIWKIIEGVPPLMGAEFQSLVKSLVSE